MTFDKQFISMDMKYEIINPQNKPNQCSYLLARDFLDLNFTLAIEPSFMRGNNNDIVSTRKLSLLTENEIINIEVVADVIRIGKNLTTLLPAKIDSAVIYRDADVLSIESGKGFTIYCNLQFDLCSVELSGWYFGKTAGLLGTMNNEKYDDLTTSRNTFAKNEQEFVDSWALPSCTNPVKVNNYEEVLSKASVVLVKLCDSFFRSKVSYFASCFSIVEPQPFYEMCLDLGTNSISHIINDAHPSQKGACTSALAYIEVCQIENTPLRVPDTCIQ